MYGLITIIQTTHRNLVSGIMHFLYYLDYQENKQRPIKQIKLD